MKKNESGKKRMLVLGKKRGPQQKKPVQKPHFTDEEEVDNGWMLMDKSSKYSVKLEEEATWTESSYLFTSNQPEMRDFFFYLSPKIITDNLLLKLRASLNLFIFLYV